MILLVMATILEAKPFINGLNLQPSEKIPFQVHTGENTALVVSGIGKVNAALATMDGCRRFRPSCVVNIGAAGAVDEAHALGEIYHINHIVEMDRPNLSTGEPLEQIPDILKGFDTATLATSDTPTIHPGDRKKARAYAQLVDMEGAAAMQACRLLDFPCYLFKGISDTPDHTSGDDIIRNIREYRAIWFDFMKQEVFPDLHT